MQFDLFDVILLVINGVVFPLFVQFVANKFNNNG